MISLYKADIDDDCNISEEDFQEEESKRVMVKGPTHIRHNTNSLNDTFMVKRKEVYFDTDHPRTSEEVKTETEMTYGETTRPLSGTV